MVDAGYIGIDDSVADALARVQAGELPPVAPLPAIGTAEQSGQAGINRP